MMVQYDYVHPRTPLSITLSVWNALFLRESVARLSAGRIAWLWLLAEPVLQISIMLFMFIVIRMRVVGGMSTEAWLIIGMVFFLMFKRAAVQVQNALGANRALFTYRQVKPIDTLLVRAGLEGFITTLIAIIFGVGGIFFGIPLIPDDPLTVLLVFFGMWLMGLGFGLVSSVAVQLIPKMSVVLGIVSTVLYLTSGVILPVSNIPPPYRDWLMVNPLLHGTEAARMGVSAYYHGITGVDVSYLYKCAIIFIFFGLVLHRRFEAKLTSL
ncbi:MAG: ABC transporter permease [Methylovulum sp.]|nr:ABC transporter permease [Methylovulum sp.]